MQIDRFGCGRSFSLPSFAPIPITLSPRTPPPPPSRRGRGGGKGQSRAILPCDGPTDRQACVCPLVCEEEKRETSSSSSSPSNVYLVVCAYSYIVCRRTADGTERGGRKGQRCYVSPARTHVQYNPAAAIACMQRASEGGRGAPATNPNQHDGIQKGGGGGDCSCYTATATALATAPTTTDGRGRTAAIHKSKL